jgi:predicted transcriptional regulator YdeE
LESAVFITHHLRLKFEILYDKIKVRGHHMTKHPRETKDCLKVIGIQMKTTNEKGQSGKDISQFWEKFRKENIFDKIPNKKDGNLLAMYSDYEGDFMQPFHYMICCEVTSLEDVPLGMIGKLVPPADYTILKAQGKFPDCLVQTWQTIWESDLKRSYRCDFEIYKKMDPEHADIDIYIGVK